MPVTIVKADNVDQAAHIARQAAEILSSGGLIVFPTETVYGVAASCGSERGVAALRALKNRPTEPFTVHLPEPAAFDRYVGGTVGGTVGGAVGGTAENSPESRAGDATDSAVNVGASMMRRLARKVMPGPVTLIVEVSDDERRASQHAMGWSDRVVDELYQNGEIGLRCPDHALGRQILASVPDPVVASSANREGQRPPLDADQAAQSVGDLVDMVVDGGPCRYGRSSTLARVGGRDGPLKLTVVRSGTYDERYLRKLMRWTLLLVCSGNTCRSPMAAAVARFMLAERRGLPVDELENAGVRVLSAGTVAAQAAPATPEAIEALRQIGVDLSGHRAQQLDVDLIREADVIYCMTESHRRAVIQMLDSARNKTHLLDPTGDIEDPLGTGASGYHRCVELIRRRIEHRLKEQPI